MWVLVLSFRHVFSGVKLRTLGLVTGDFTYSAISLALDFILKGFIKEVRAALYFLPFNPWSNKKQPCKKDRVYNCKRAVNNVKEMIIVADLQTNVYKLPGFKCCLYNIFAHVSSEYVTFEV